MSGLSWTPAGTEWADYGVRSSYDDESAKRKDQLTDDLLTAAGVPPDLLASEGRADSEPVGDNKTKQGRAENRRIEIKIDGVVVNDLEPRDRGLERGGSSRACGTGAAPSRRRRRACR